MSILASLRLSRTPALAFAVLGVGWGVFAAELPVIKARLGVSDGTFGLLLLGSAFGLMTSLWAAPRADRRFGARALQIGAAGLAAIWLLPGFVTVPLLFGLTMILVGAAAGLFDVSMNARVSEIEALTGRSLMNANHGMFSLAYGLAALLTGMAREAGLGPEAVFALLAAGISVTIPALRIAPVPAPAAAEGAGSGMSLPVLVCGTLVFVAFAAEATVESWSALHIERTLGGRAAEGALGPAMLGLTMALGRFSGQVVAERMREARVVIWAALLAAAGAMIAAVAAAPWLGYMGFGILGLGVSVIGPLGLALTGKIAEPHLRTVAIARSTVMGFAGFFLAPVMMGLLSELLGLRAAFGAVAMLLFSAVPLGLWLLRPGR